ncbi:MAG: type 4a pilus biogenesis protein PilO [Candidatus Omnitrophica bacterium]|nr:type 4a pilus biogenesis protein PilO [Candidatus Omnitrophota bacterium]
MAIDSALLKKNKAIAIFLLVSFMGLGGGYFLLYMPKAQEIEDLKAQLLPLLFQISENEKMIFRVPDPNKEIQLLKERIQRLSEQASSKEEIPKIIQQLARKTTELNIDVISIIPREDLKDLAEDLPAGVSKVYIEIRISCAYRQVAEYIKELGNLATLFTVEDLVIEKDPEEVTDVLKVRLILSTYVLA